VFLQKYVKTYLLVNVSIKSQVLKHNQSNYNEYQEYLYDLCKDLHESGLGYRKISYFLNENEILSSKGCILKNNHVYSILKKGQIRLDRLKSLEDSKFKYNISINSVMLTHEDFNVEDYKY